MGRRHKDLWGLVLDEYQVDPQELATAITEEVRLEPLDFRTRLLIRDCITALGKRWGAARLNAWLSSCPARPRIDAICRETPGEPGFPFLENQVVEPTRSETIEQMLRELGSHLHRPERLVIGGSGALILGGYLTRQTQDLDIVDEVPAEIRSLGRPLKDLVTRFRLQIAHFQSHYLPKGWEARLHSLGSFGRLQVFIVDVYDIFLSKLFSGREKDRDDLRFLLPQLDKDILTRKLGESAAAFLSEPTLRARAEHNWYILYGEPLPA
ncbi:MAG TPA: DUF6036 family nucleotidyltransferase [Gemmataceae bacterium]|nr:DUF6036 family nucleotidyltransferase [Gemmataceae bacterium]